MGDDLDLALADLLDVDVVAQVARAALDLDVLVQELLEAGDVEDLVADGLLAVDTPMSDRGSRRTSISIDIYSSRACRNTFIYQSSCK